MRVGVEKWIDGRWEMNLAWVVVMALADEGAAWVEVAVLEAVTPVEWPHLDLCVELDVVRELRSALGAAGRVNISGVAIESGMPRRPGRVDLEGDAEQVTVTAVVESAGEAPADVRRACVSRAALAERLAFVIKRVDPGGVTA